MSLRTCLGLYMGSRFFIWFYKLPVNRVSLSHGIKSADYFSSPTWDIHFDMPTVDSFLYHMAFIFSMSNCFYQISKGHPSSILITSSGVLAKMLNLLSQEYSNFYKLPLILHPFISTSGFLPPYAVPALAGTHETYPTASSIYNLSLPLEISASCHPYCAEIQTLLLVWLTARKIG